MKILPVEAKLFRADG